MKKSSVRSTNQAFKTVAVGLRNQAKRPNLYGYVPHDKQQAFHSSSHRKKLFLGGNRSGKTVGGALETCWWLTGKHPYISTPEPPVYGRACSVDFLYGVEQIIKPQIARWLPMGELRGGSWETSYDKELRTLTLANGSELEFKSYDQPVEKFAGTSRHFIWFDEEPPRDIYVECLLRLVDTEGSFWMTLTPLEGMSGWIYQELYERSREDETIFCVTVDMGDNPHINQGEVDVLLSGLNTEELQQRKEGKFVQIGGLIYQMFDLSKHVIDEVPIPSNWLHVAGMDHGFNNPTAWLWAAIDSDGRVIVYDEYYEQGKIVKVHAEKVLEINARHGRIPDYCVGDPSIRNIDPITGTSILLEYEDHGVSIVLGNNDQKAGINRVSRYLTGIDGKPQLYITRNCTNLIREMARLRWASWATKKHRYDKNKKEEQHKKDDHAADALRYLISSRPEMDDGTSIPEIKGPRGAAIAHNPHTDFVDDELAGILHDGLKVDFHMGEDF